MCIYAHHFQACAVAVYIQKYMHAMNLPMEIENKMSLDACMSCTVNAVHVMHSVQHGRNNIDAGSVRSKYRHRYTIQLFTF